MVLKRSQSDFLLWKSFIIWNPFSSLVLIQDHKANFFQNLKRILLSIIFPPPPRSIGSEIQCTSLIFIKDQSYNRNDTIDKMSISFELHVDDCIHLWILLSDFFPYGKNNKQWAILCSLTDFSFQLESFKQLRQWLCHYNNFSKPKVFAILLNLARLPKPEVISSIILET